MIENSVVAAAPARAAWWLRLGFVIVGLVLWFLTQWLISLRGLAEGPEAVTAAEVMLRGDRLLNWTSGIHASLRDHRAVADLLLIVSSLVIDILGVFLLAWSIFGASIRPFLGLLMLFTLRQLSQVLCALPAPPETLWPLTADQAPRLPELLGGWAFPSLLVTYEVANDFFFSGHTALAVYGAVELARFGRWPLKMLALLVAVGESMVVLVLRAHWTIDVVAGVLAALYAGQLAARLAPGCDRFLAKLSGRV